MRKISFHKRERNIILIYCLASTLLSLFFLYLSQGKFTVSAFADPTRNTPPQIWVDVAGKVKSPGLYSLGVDARINDALNAAGGVLSGVDLTALNLAAHVVDGEEIIIGSKTSATPYALIMPIPQVQITPSGGVESGGGVASTSNSKSSTSVSSTSSPSGTNSHSQSSKATSGNQSTPSNHSASSSKQNLPAAPISKSSNRNKKGAPASAININTATIDQLEQLPGIGPVMAQKVINFRNKYGKFNRISDIQNVAGMGAAHFAKIKNYIKTG